MTLPPAIANRVIEAAAHEIAKLAGCELTELQLLSYDEAARLLGVSKAKAKRLLREFVELGEATRRVKLSTVKELIETRTIRI
jgi:excisionase family DNA binding protein